MIGEILAFVSALCFALGSIAIAKSPPMQRSSNGLLLSIILTALFSLAAWLALGSPLPAIWGSYEPWRAIGAFALSGIFATVWGRTSLYRSVELAGVVRATTIRRLTPFFSALFAWTILGEAVSATAFAGLLALGASFAVLYVDNRRLDHKSYSKEDISKGSLIALLCALVYAASYVARRDGLLVMPDPYLGALIGALTALVYFQIASILGPRSGLPSAQSLLTVNGYQFTAAAMISLGQVIQFVALSHTTVARVAVINSVEIFLSTYLAVFVFRMERFPSTLAILATVLATLGLVTIASG